MNQSYLCKADYEPPIIDYEFNKQTYHFSGLSM